MGEVSLPAFTQSLSLFDAVVGGVSGGSLRVLPWHKSGNRGESTKGLIIVCKISGRNFHLGVIAKP